ncbi:hypothetical protein BRARA_I05181 [Brassica rapa]|uniref:Uncharacterized protein n=1 Tax=Brassica campestris TaxID=3711 RepID=A0A397YA38_BRACM|nr:hypothetical protein BRARA_I05181 [Brassica rapa]
MKLGNPLELGLDCLFTRKPQINKYFKVMWKKKTQKGEGKRGIFLIKRESKGARKREPVGRVRKRESGSVFCLEERAALFT